MNHGIRTQDHHPQPRRPEQRRGRHQLRPTLNLLEDRLLLAVAPQTYTVNNLNDSGPGSLRAAIASANADSYSGSASDTIVFDSSLAGQTIGLTTVGDNSDGNSALAITAPILIDGSTAPGLTIFRASTTLDFRIFYVAGGGNLTLNDLTINGGRSSGYGGGLENEDGTVTLTGDTFSNNSAGQLGGGLLNGGTATLTGDTFTNDSVTQSYDFGGGGIVNFGNATLMDGHFTSDSARSKAAA